MGKHYFMEKAQGCGAGYNVQLGEVEIVVRG